MIHQCEETHKCSADLGNALLQVLDTKLIYQPLLLLSDDDGGDDGDYNNGDQEVPLPLKLLQLDEDDDDDRAGDGDDM